MTLRSEGQSGLPGWPSFFFLALSLPPFRDPKAGPSRWQCGSARAVRPPARGSAVLVAGAPCG